MARFVEVLLFVREDHANVVMPVLLVLAALSDVVWSLLVAEEEEEGVVSSGGSSVANVLADTVVVGALVVPAVKSADCSSCLLLMITYVLKGDFKHSSPQSRLHQEDQRQ